MRHHAESGLAVKAKADHDHVAGLATDEVARPVDGIDHPHARLCQTRAVVGQFLRQNRVAGKLLRQAADDERVGRQISLGDRLAAVLVLHCDGLLGKAAHQGSGFPGQPARDGELVRKIGRATHPRYSSIRSRTNGACP